jgi:hypothetical protein
VRADGETSGVKTVFLALLLAIGARAADIQVFFSPKGGCTDAIVKSLGRATNSVLVQAYSFTSAPIAKALVDAEQRGVNVRVVLDKSQRTGRYGSADFVQRAGILTYTRLATASGASAAARCMPGRIRPNTIAAPATGKSRWRRSRSSCARSCTSSTARRSRLPFA